MHRKNLKNSIPKCSHTANATHRPTFILAENENLKPIPQTPHTYKQRLISITQNNTNYEKKKKKKS